MTDRTQPTMSERELEDMAHSANQEALSFGVNFDVFMKLARAVESKASAELAKRHAAEVARLQAEIAALAAGPGQTVAARDMLAERGRQISAKGWTHDHDDGREAGELASASAAYALAAADEIHPLLRGAGGFQQEPPPAWPWDASGWKPSCGRRMLIKAGALVLAEIERLDRLAALDGKNTA